jgi:membrane fusion protein, multidrug efflux system
MIGRSKIKPLIIVCLLVMLAFGYFYLINSGKKQVSQASPSHITEVSIISVKSQEVQIFKELPARVSAYKISEVRPQANGIIKKQLFEEGSFVEAGTALYQIDPSIYKADYESAHAQLKAAGMRKDRYAKLLKIDAISRQEYDDALAEFEQARSLVKKANINLDYAKIYAPISGYVGKSNVTEGTLVSANQAQVLTTITQLDPIFVDISLPARDLIKMGDQQDIPVTVNVDGVEYDDEGRLQFSEVFVDEITDSVRLVAKFSNENKKLIPGMFVNAKLHLKPIQAVKVPQRVTNRGPNGALLVWVVDKDNVVHAREIKVLQPLESDWVVLEGLEGGEVLVYEGFKKIFEGALVTTVVAKSSLINKDGSGEVGEK